MCLPVCVDCDSSEDTVDVNYSACEGTCLPVCVDCDDTVDVN